MRCRWPQTFDTDSRAACRAAGRARGIRARSCSPTSSWSARSRRRPSREEARVRFLARPLQRVRPAETTRSTRPATSWPSCPGAEPSGNILVGRPRRHRRSPRPTDHTHQRAARPWSPAPAWPTTAWAWPSSSPCPTLLERSGPAPPEQPDPAGRLAQPRPRQPGGPALLPREQRPAACAAGVCVEGVQPRPPELRLHRHAARRNHLHACPRSTTGPASAPAAPSSPSTRSSTASRPSPSPAGPARSVIFGSISGGTAYSTIPAERPAALRDPQRIRRHWSSEIRQRIDDIADEVAAQTGAEVTVDIFAAARARRHRLLPSRSSAAPADHEGRSGIDPARRPQHLRAVGAHRPRHPGGHHRPHPRRERSTKPDESVEIEPIFTGLAQLVGILLAIDGEVLR